METTQYASHYLDEHLYDEPEHNTAPPHYLLQFFEFEHLPQALREVSEPFYELALNIDERLLSNPEKDEALRKLLEAKDCAMRAATLHLQAVKRRECVPHGF